MRSKSIQVALIYFVGLMQGISLVTYPSAASLLTSPAYNNLSPREYGILFVPLIIGAILSSLLGGKLATSWGLRPVFLLGLLFNLLSMVLYVSTEFFLDSYLIDFILLLLALFALGIGFGQTVTIINTYVIEFYPTHTATALPILHSFLGIGTALSPLIFNYFASNNKWWGDPILVAGIFFLLIIAGSLILPEKKVSNRNGGVSRASYNLPMVFWLFVGATFLYGICETVFGNWAVIYLHKGKGLTSQEAAFGLSLFWAMVTVGRMIISLASLWISPSKIFILLPFMICVAFILIPQVSGGLPNILAYGFAGLACSGCFPLSFSFAGSRFPAYVSVVSGGLMASYMLGYGIASFGIGELYQTWQLSLSTIYYFSIIPALGLAVMVLIFTLPKQITRP